MEFSIVELANWRIVELANEEELEFRVGVGELVLSLLFVRCPVASEVVDASVVADGGGAREEQPHG